MRHDLSAIPESVEVPAGRTRLLARLYRDIGLAAVAEELELTGEKFEPELAAAIERGSRYLPRPRMAFAS